MRTIVVGSGPAGIYTAITASMESKVTLIEKEERLGGTCVLYGCIPSKGMITPVRYYSYLLDLGKAPSLTFDEVRRMGREASSRLSKGVEYMLESHGVEVVHGEGSLKSGGIEVGGQRIDGDFIAVTTGGYREKQEGILYSETLPYVDLDFQSVVIFGGDVGGLEYGWMLKKIGKDVTIVDKNTSLMPYLDKEISQALTNQFRRIGINLLLGKEVKKVEKGKLETSDGSEIRGDVVYVTFGRKAEIRGFENLPHDNYIKVDDYLFTGINGIYAGGDVIGTHTAHHAMYAGSVIGKNILGRKTKFDKTGIPYVVYTDPELAYVGEMKGSCVKVQMASLARPITDRMTSGFLKVCAEGSRIVGAQAFMHDAEDVISIIAMAIRLNLTLDQLSEYVAPHPSYIEAVTEAIRELNQQK
ncbi:MULTISPECIES: NAD(P)/FAD-dependent oxidoreductase [Acidianus]|uniref:Pyridine nucleotide-disulfide oxidoreductase n=1 Tax=Candidatus Acidianus copahuensis TaxID=1160895 RepID=A0A031LW58_9CREN|nr:MULTISPECIES: NAD(P)/FAD-dependent oxidoreductase [Acidianus]EZQ12041.1 pyridine nucleotide-disulfide oxidoreductase [Candidatus Acidianus copahuensis]NON63054.1 NAD(P)/FAD-dependent oxidoreductase [Acidianus sp. RZ1]